MAVTFDSVAHASGGGGSSTSFTHTTSASPLSNALLFVASGTIQNASAPTGATCNGAAMTAIPNSASVNVSGNTMGVWGFATALGGLAASQNLAIVISGGAGYWDCQSVVVSGAIQSGLSSFSVAGYTNNSPSTDTFTTSLGVPSGGMVIDAFAAWWPSVTTITASGTVAYADTTGYDSGGYGTQYTTSAGSVTWTLGANPYTVCMGSWAIPEASITVTSQQGLLMATFM